ncbi:uncharacterized protein LOC131882685 [Tigriopus californicus]|uniref:uncharacterized protein LOC131882685 n=1 Tax=Tigriopus californicus TaxID=6832 RepID=UPI0027D9FC6C|nr:uncharacterized protein LOC131882685 [Tigriopus californicus]|eukprot:TCALIF_13090-PA protein Name:"Protein of unknown function" AED:0.00 eAED:0.00 QI:84/1/1/1/1/0.8/5/183/421
MDRLGFVLFLVLGASTTSLVSAQQDWTKDMLDAMQQLLTGDTFEFDPIYLAKLYSCFDKIDPKLKEAQDLAWQGMVNYHDQNGQPGDEWGSCLGNGHCAVYFEQNATQQIFHNITIYEPCNYASNVPYYHVTTQICDHWDLWNVPADVRHALGTVFASLGFGSSFWHGSHTYAGNVADNRVIEVLAYVVHQASLQNLNVNSTVLMDLSMIKRPYSGVEIKAQLTDMFLEQSPEQWAETINSFDMPNYYKTFAGIVCTVFSVALENETADQIIDALIALFSFPPEEEVFIKEHYLPEMRALTATLNLTTEEKLVVQGNFESALIKLLYAFVWQEWAIGENPIIYDPAINEQGADLIPVINAFANSLNTFPIYDQDVQDGVNSYPGDEWCNDYSPHAKWHLQAANGLMDLVFLGDDLHKLLKA